MARAPRTIPPRTKTEKRRGEHTVGATKQKEAEEPDFAKYSPGTLIETMDVIGKALERICFESHASISVLLVIASDDECKTRIHFCEPHISKMALAANEEIHEASMGFEELRSLEETANNKPI